MKKSLFFSIFFLFTSSAIANEVMFANKSSSNPIEVTYQFCRYSSDNQYICGPINLIAINQNAHIITTPPPDSDSIRVISASEKNSSGVVVAKGKYTYEGFSGSHCGYPMLMGKEGRNNVVIILDDFDGSHAIVCDAKGY